MQNQTIKLKHSLLVDGREITEVTLRRPKVRDLRNMDKQKGSDMEKTLWMIGSLSEMTPAEVDEIDAEDLEAISGVIAGFTERGQ